MDIDAHKKILDMRNMAIPLVIDAFTSELRPSYYSLPRRSYSALVS